MNFLFLDVDGVLSALGEHGLCSTRLDLLADIVKQTKAEVVLSSTWRMPHCREPRKRLQQELFKRGIEFHSFTPVINPLVGSGALVLGVVRGDEIRTWIQEHKRFETIDKFVILDDDPNDEMGPLKPHLVKCDGWTGLTPELAQECIKRLT